jgi:GNAT superfamily N-acetyltransferase
MATLHLLNSITALSYQSFTYPFYRSRLQRLTPQGNDVAIGAVEDDQPVGLLLAEIEPPAAVIHSIYVKPSHRQRGIATALLKQLEQTVLRQVKELHLVYITGKSTTVALEKLLQSNDWAAAETSMIVCKSTTDRIADAPWMQQSYLPSAFQIVPWAEITTAEVQQVEQQQAANPWIPADLAPSRQEGTLEPVNSLGLRYQGQIVGWVLTHRLDASTIRYTCSFIRPDFQRMGRLIPVYVEAIRRQHEAGIPNGIWTVPVHHPAMFNFVKQRMAPYMISVEETRRVTKALAIKCVRA